jgi:hypothetical protein
MVVKNLGVGCFWVENPFLRCFHTKTPNKLYKSLSKSPTNLKIPQNYLIKPKSTKPKKINETRSSFSSMFTRETHHH